MSGVVSVVEALQGRELWSSLRRKRNNTRLLRCPETSDPRYRYLVRKCFRRVQASSRKVFSTRVDVVEEDYHNPVYDVQYSPDVHGGYRVLAAADERGYLSIVRDPVDRSRAQGCLAQDKYATSVRQGEGDESDPGIFPVLYSLAWSASGDRIVAGYGNGVVRIWDVAGKGSPAHLIKVDDYQKAIKRVAWRDHDSSTIVSCSRGNEIRVHDLRMRNHLANQIDCNKVNTSSKLTDVCVIDSNFITASSSNHTQVSLWDLRYTYKLYKRVKPVSQFDLGGAGGVICMRSDSDSLYCLRTDGIVKRIDLNNSDPVSGSGFRVPDSGVDFFSKIDIDSVGQVLVVGGSKNSAFGFDLTEVRGSHVLPFFELSENVSRSCKFVDGDVVVEDPGKENVEEVQVGRTCSAVAFAKRRQPDDSYLQIATGGDDSCLTVWD